jgi:hypothetical protein
LVAARAYLGADILAALSDIEVLVAAAWMGGLGVAVGLLGGAAAGFLLAAGRQGTVVSWAFVAAAFGAVGGGLTPLLVRAARPWLPAEASSAAAWALAGLLTGVAGYVWSRREEPEEPQDTEAGRGHAVEVWPIDSGPRQAPDRAGVRLLPILGVAGVCLVAVVATPASDAGWAVLAVALLALAVAWALGGQERRIRELELQLRQRGDGPSG